MDAAAIESCLADCDLPGFRYYPSLASTNDEALRWAEEGAPHLSLVIADQQTHGRGRLKRHWVTTAGGGLAFSLVLRPPHINPRLVTRLSGLGALAVHHALQKDYALQPAIKWPNDILLDDRKVAGVLVEASWDGQALSAVILGIGINIAPSSLEKLAVLGTELNFPATCVENALGHPVRRLELLHSILRELKTGLERIGKDEFIAEWENCLAYLGELVYIDENAALVDPSLPSEARQPAWQGTLAGLDENGALQLLTHNGTLVSAAVGEIRLQLAHKDGKSTARLASRR